MLTTLSLAPKIIICFENRTEVRDRCEGRSAKILSLLLVVVLVVVCCACLKSHLVPSVVR